jgi:tetratricopeptide (TPR) repeat protein
MEARNTKGQTLHLRVALKELGTYSSGCGYVSCVVVDEHKNSFSLVDDVDHKKYLLNFGDDNSMWAHPMCNQASNKEDCTHSAERFAAGLNGLRTWAQQNHASPDSFRQKAAAWKALATKPPLSEEVRIRRALAEDAIQQQKPEEGLNYYELGLQIDPTWAQGWFNAAVIAGNLGYYADAAEHMQNYIELIPDAPDAEKAREQVGMWKYKAKNN